MKVIEKSIFPTYLFEEDDKYDDILDLHNGDDDFLTISQAGLYLNKTGGNGIIAEIPMEKSEFIGLAKQTPKVGWRGAKIPFNLFREIQRFFYDVYNDIKTEAAVVLFYNKDLQDWKVLYPIQIDLSGAAVSYVMTLDSTDAKVVKALLYEEDNEESKGLLSQVNIEREALYSAGYVKLGTIHSHCNFSAFHSGTDDNDEIGFDGIHITIGNLLGDISYAQRIMCGKWFSKIENIKSIVDLGEYDLDDLKNVVNTDSIYPAVKNRMYNNSRNVTVYGSKKVGGTYKYNATTGRWELEDKKSSWNYYDWNNKDSYSSNYQSSYNAKYEQGDLVEIKINGCPYIGVVVAKCPVEERYYFVKTKEHPFPVYCSVWVHIERKIDPEKVTDLDLDFEFPKEKLALTKEDNNAACKG